MKRRFSLKGALLALSVGTMLAFWGGCLNTTVQRVVVAAAADWLTSL
ncbi:MAG: hypothetical protein PVJ57_07545 [Phycisphaerae bacterium]|jgi:hypothetical protein